MIPSIPAGVPSKVCRSPRLKQRSNLAALSGDRLRGSNDAGQFEHWLCGVLEGQHDLEKRMARERAGWIKDLDQPLEGQLLMGVSGQIGGTHPGQKLAKAGVSGGIGAQDQGINEEADQFLKRVIGAAGNGAADRDIGAGPQPAEQGG